MTQNLSPRANWRLISEAFFGTTAARNLHRLNVATPITSASALQVIASRWSDLRSPDTSEPIFILAAGWRSGSTFLQRALMSNPDIMIWGEPYRYCQVVESMARQIHAFTYRWPEDWFFADHESRVGDLTEKWVANLYPEMRSFLDAHLTFFHRLLVAPALARNRRRWGFKEVALSVDHACYLRWLFPRAKFIFLIRNPYEAYRSYRRWRNWYRAWPDEPVFTPASFGKFWKELAADFASRHAQVDGLLVRYEDLSSAAAWRRMGEYLGIPLEEPVSVPRITGDNARLSQWFPRLERYLLRRQVEPIGSSLGYHS